MIPHHLYIAHNLYLTICLNVWNNGCQLGLRVVSPDVAQNSCHIGFVEGMNEGRHSYTCMLCRGVRRGAVRREIGTGRKEKEREGKR